MKQYLYVVSAGMELCKVGIAKDHEKRRRSLEKGCGYPLAATLVVGPFNSAKLLEATVHKSLASHRQEGEWFKCNERIAVASVQQALVGYVDKPDETAAQRQAREDALDGLIGLMTAPIRARAERAEHTFAVLESIAQPSLLAH